MRVLIASEAERTHFLTLVPLAWALRTAGHEVRVAANPELAAAISGAGLNAVPVGRDHLFRHVMKRVFSTSDDDLALPKIHLDVGREELKQWYRRVVPWWWRTVNEPMMADLVAFCRHWKPDLVIWEQTTYSAPIAARACGAAHARLVWSVDLFDWLRRRYLRLSAGQQDEEPEDLLASWMRARSAAFGCEFSEDMTRGEFALGYAPASLELPLDPPLAKVGMRFVAYNGRAVVPEWLRTPPERRRVCLSLGTTAIERMGRYSVSVAELLESLADLDVEVVATIDERERAKLRSVPANARLVGFTPLHALAPTCSALIGWGGAGTVFTGMLYGVPQLILSHVHMFDTPLLGRLLTERGAGLTIPDREMTTDAVREHVRRLIEEPGFARESGRLRAEMLAMPAPNDAVPELERRTADIRANR